MNIITYKDKKRCLQIYRERLKFYISIKETWRIECAHLQFQISNEKSDILVDNFSIPTSDTLANKTETRKTLLNHSAGQSVAILTRLLKCLGPQPSSSWSPVISNLQTSFSTTTLLILTQTWLELGCLQQEKYIKDYRSHQRTLRHTVNLYSILKSLWRNSYCSIIQENSKIVCVRYNLMADCPAPSLCISCKTQPVGNGVKKVGGADL